MDSVRQEKQEKILTLRPYLNVLYETSMLLLSVLERYKFIVSYFKLMPNVNQFYFLVLHI